VFGTHQDNHRPIYFIISIFSEIVWNYHAVNPTTGLSIQVVINKGFTMLKHRQCVLWVLEEG